MCSKCIFVVVFTALSKPEREKIIIIIIIIDKVVHRTPMIENQGEQIVLAEQWRGWEKRAFSKVMDFYWFSYGNREWILT